MTNAQPAAMLVAGLPLPTTAGLPAGLPVQAARGGATVGEPRRARADGRGRAGRRGGGWDATGAALVGAGAGTDETCETCETWETCPPEPDT